MLLLSPPPPRSLSRQPQVGVGFVVPSHDRPVGLRLLPLDHQGFLLRYVARCPFSPLPLPPFSKCSPRVLRRPRQDPDTQTLFSLLPYAFFAAGQAGIEAAEAEASGANLLALPSTTATSSSSSSTAAADSTKSLMQLKQEKDDEERKKRKATATDGEEGGGAKKSRTDRGDKDAAAEKDFTGVTEKEMGESFLRSPSFPGSCFLSRSSFVVRRKPRSISVSLALGRRRLLLPSHPPPRPMLWVLRTTLLRREAVVSLVRSRLATRSKQFGFATTSSWSNLSRRHRLGDTLSPGMLFPNPASLQPYKHIYDISIGLWA